MTRRLIFVALVVVSAVALAAAAAAVWVDDDDNPPQGRPEAISLSDASRTAIVWAVGDGGNGSEPAKRVADVIARSRPDRLLYLGDVYEDGTREEFDRNYRSVYGRFDTITAPAPGNHEWPNHEEGYDPYWKAANPRLPQNRHWYSFKTAGWEILSLNSEEGQAAGSPQVRWIERRVRGGGTCRIAFMHRPFLNAGRHGDQPQLEPLWNAVRDRAVLVISAHDHNMQRFRQTEGMVQLISGAGGDGHYSSNENDPRLVWDEDDEYGALRLDLRRGLARFRFVNADGKTLHRGRMRCRPITG